MVNFDPKQFHGSGVKNNVFNFTTITIPAAVTVKLSGNVINGPVYWLAQGDVDIEGTTDLSGQAGFPATPILDGRRRPTSGPGGFSGGVGGKFDGSAPPPVPQPGDGPGGGAPAVQQCGSFGYGGTFTGNQFLVPLVGGSGGGGGAFSGDLGSTPYGASGGAGGGALFIASSTTITVNGTINANGGAGGVGSTGGCYPGYGGGASGGGIRLATNTIVGSGTLTAVGGASAPTGGSVNGGNGVVRIEVFTDNFAGSVSGTESTGSPFATFVPSTPPPSVTVVSVNGNNVTQPRPREASRRPT